MKSMMKILALSGLMGGCMELACTEMGCVGGLMIDFEVFEPGTWTFEIDLIDGGEVTETVTCSETLPFTDDAPVGCDHADVYLVASGSALDESQHSIAGLEMSNLGPEQVAVRVTLDGEEQLSSTFTPEYSSYSPNGEECGPTCTSAALTLDL